MLLRIITIIMLFIAGVSNLQSQIWISKVDPISQESLQVQALVVKDEEVAAAVGCKAATRNDVRYTNKRYLMCAGSILTSRYILTSASCIHKATHIRHNIRAPLAVMIAPFSDTAQVIKIAGYSIHPGHLVDPKDEHHSLYNVAIAKLVCRISKHNLYEIKLPTQPFVDECAEDSCKVIITKKIGPMSFIMYEIAGGDISVVREKRDLLIVSEIKKLNETVNETRFNNHDIKKVLESDENGNEARIIERTKRANNENSKFINEKNFKARKNDNAFKRSSTLYHNPNRKLVIRESNGIEGCPQTGSAIMSNIIQSAMVTVSCDDRQPETPCQYTDLFNNLDWINEMTGNWKPSPTLGGCSTCIYNFFIDYNCKNQSQCQKNLHSGSHPTDIKIPVQLQPKCSKNHTDLKTPFAHNHSEIETTESVNQAYIDAIHNLYLNKHDHTDENDNDSEFRPDLSTNGKNSYRNVDETVKLGLFSQSPVDFNAVANLTSEKTLVLHYKDNQADLDPNYRKVKATYDNDYKPKGYAYGNEHPERKNRDYQPRYNQIKKPGGVTSSRKSVENLEGSFLDGKREPYVIPKEFAELYQKFLEEHRQSRAKINKNVVKRA